MAAPVGHFPASRFGMLRRMFMNGRRNGMAHGPHGRPQQCRGFGGGVTGAWGTSPDWKKDFQERKAMFEKAMKERKAAGRGGDWKDWKELKEMRRSFGGFGGNFNCGFGFGGGNSTDAAMDVRRTATEIEVKLDVAGVQKSDLKVELAGAELVISGKREVAKVEGDLEKEGWLVKERSWASFRRTVPVPEGCHAENVSSKLTDGVLSVTVRLPSGVGAQRIEIQ